MTRNPNPGGTNQSKSPKDMATWKPGSDAASARDVAAEGDFGVPVGAGPSPDRDYVSRNTKRSDPGNAMPRSGETEGLRTTGAGASAAGDGSGSGGDLDPDFVGVGTGGSGVAMSGPSDRRDKSESDGTSAEMASGRPAAGRNQAGVHRVGGSKRVPGSVVSGDLDFHTGADGQTSDNVNNPARGDDSFAAEVTLGEALGEDNAIGDSSDNPDNADPTAPDVRQSAPD